MRLNAPKKNIFWICVIAAIVAVVAYVIGLIISLPVLLHIAAVVLLASFVVLVLGNVLKGF